ncbi:unnamed protein product [Brachionus calyciflorus]|uniref:Uncharacterized protein n=1 Tax=Brachionus calyciflorus TaxID=104777 RepID=A0A813NT60_9BILA|nr:unnamed protein product [Brachionus calyciflorus]
MNDDVVANSSNTTTKPIIITTTTKILTITTATTIGSTIKSTTTTSGDSSFFNMYSTITFSILAFVLIVAMLTAIVIYKMRIKYLIKRQIIQLKRVDAQLGRERQYVY